VYFICIAICLTLHNAQGRHTYCRPSLQQASRSEVTVALEQVDSRMDELMKEKAILEKVVVHLIHVWHELMSTAAPQSSSC
jgi:hypothetical protein